MAEIPPTVGGHEPHLSKPEIVQNLGESSLVLPLLINRGLEANDRAKYLLALIQAARAHADQPDRPFSSLREDRLAAGVANERLDGLVEQARLSGEDRYLVPGIGTVHAGLAEAISDMIAPLEVAGVGPDGYVHRLQALLADAPDLNAGCIPGAYVERMASADRRSGDSLHLLIMDAHRALNQLQIEVATEILDGAFVYGLDVGDRSLVSSFMAGLHATEPLKFDHPGLGTTATRSGPKVLIENDIGMTNAHVIVVAVEGLAVTVTYSDVHLERLNFFESMLGRFSVRWSDTYHQHDRGALGEHHVVSGRFDAPDRESLESYLRYLGSRLVFLIDWNRARKRLGLIVKKRQAIELLRWAADEDLGHLAFLQMGGERLIFEAIELSNRVPLRYGEPLGDVLGIDATLAVLRFAIRTSSEGMLEGKSAALVRDEVRIEVLKHVQAAHQQLFDLVAEHGSLVVETAQSLRAALIRLGMPGGNAHLNRASARAATWEHRADEILGAVRLAAERVDGAGAIASTVSRLDDAIDDLEEALFLLTLLPAGAIAVVCPILEPLAGITVFAAREHLKALEIARELVGGGGDDELDDFLVAVDKVVTFEHEADGADRSARSGLVEKAPEFRSLHVADLISCAMEDATDALSHSAHLLRDHMLAQMAAR
ncbi:MAG: hypothetical protein ACLQOZ_13225 [Acidimicrobiales bacterium]|jgi:uncharacterized protein Yka (UPF0111/DUF47 family)